MNALSSQLGSSTQVNGTGTKPTKAPKMREARFEDQPQIDNLKYQFGLTTRGWAECQHLWITNPAYQRFNGEWPTGWVLEVQDRIVGHLGNVPTCYEFRGETLVAGSGRGWVVLPEYRGFAVLLLNQYLTQDRADFVLSNTVNLESFNVHMALGSLKVPGGPWDESPAWITSYSDFTADWIGRKKPSMPKVASYPAALALWSKDFRNRARVTSRASSAQSVEICTVFDDRFDDFWNELRVEYPDKLLAERNRSTLQWHFEYATNQNRVWVLTLANSGRLRAYAVLLLEKSKPGEATRRMILADFQTLDEGEKPFFAVLANALDLCRKLKIHLLLTPGQSASGTDFSTLAPYHVRQPNWVFVYKAIHPDLTEALTDSSVWCPSFYDADASM